MQLFYEAMNFYSHVALLSSLNSLLCRHKYQYLFIYIPFSHRIDLQIVWYYLTLRIIAHNT